MNKNQLAVIDAALYDHGSTTTTTDHRELEIDKAIDTNKFVYSKYTHLLSPNSNLTTQQNTKLSNKTIKQRKKNKLARKARKIN